MRLGIFSCEFVCENGQVLGLERHIAISGCGLEGDEAAFWAQAGTYKVGLGGLVELLLGARADVGIWRAVSRVSAAAQRCGEGYTPGARVPSNTWLMSMTAGGLCCVQAGVCLWAGELCSGLCWCMLGRVPWGRQ